MEVYPLVMTNIAIEHGPVEIVSFPIENGDFCHSYVSYVNVYQRVDPGGLRQESRTSSHSW